MSISSYISKLSENQIQFLQNLGINNSDNLQAQIDAKISELENLNWETKNFNFIQVSLKTATEIAQKFNLQNLKNDLQDSESWLFNHIT